MVEGEHKQEFDARVLGTFEKDQLVTIIMELQKEKKELKICNDSSQRFIELERSHYLYMQYGRRESVEITGIPIAVKTEQLEEEVISVYKEANVEVDGRELSHHDIAACHRIGKKGVTIVRFVNRKFAWQGLANGKNLKDKKVYDQGDVYINNSFCDEFKKYGYYIRKLRKKGDISGYKLKSGVYQIKKGANDDFKEVSHISDFENYGLDISQFIKE